MIVRMVNEDYYKRRCPAMIKAGIRSATDVTGFGLLGHLRQMLRASGLSARIHSQAVPFLPGAVEP